MEIPAIRCTQHSCEARGGLGHWDRGDYKNIILGTTIGSSGQIQIILVTTTSLMRRNNALMPSNKTELTRENSSELTPVTLGITRKQRRKHRKRGKSEDHFVNFELDLPFREGLKKIVEFSTKRLIPPPPP